MTMLAPRYELVPVSVRRPAPVFSKPVLRSSQKSLSRSVALMTTSLPADTLIVGRVMAAPPFVGAPSMTCPTPDTTEPAPITVRPLRSA